MAYDEGIKGIYRTTGNRPTEQGTIFTQVRTARKRKKAQREQQQDDEQHEDSLTSDEGQREGIDIKV